MKNLTFGQALEALKQGKIAARKGWNGKGMFVFLRPPFECDTQQPNGFYGLLSIPDAVKSWYKKQGNIGSVKFTNYLCMKAADNTIVNGWLASQTDMLAEDWEVLEMD
jgi:Protein of unknown function (DUF2829)